jgi:hypothetical protein
MSLNEHIIEDTVLDWFLLRSAPLNHGAQVGELGYAVCHGPLLAPGATVREWASTGCLIPFDLIVSKVFLNLN